MTDAELVIKIVNSLKAGEVISNIFVKDLLGRYILERSSTQWLTERLARMVEEIAAAAQISLDTTLAVRGAFSDLDSIFIEAYLYCTDKKILRDKSFTIIDGGKKE